jgi:energy-coupling factor transporter ATP-binding protein EcfA2
MIEKIIIQNFKIFDSFELSLNDDLNIVVGNNESGKSTLLEAISLALTKKIGGRPIEYEISPYLFNKECANLYLESVHKEQHPELPRILIELYLADREELQFLRGSNNSQKTDSVGVKIEIEFNEDFREEYTELLKDPLRIRGVPVEYYKMNWFSFAFNQLSSRSLPIGLSNIDATTIRLLSGTTTATLKRMWRPNTRPMKTFQR